MTDSQIDKYGFLDLSGTNISIQTPTLRLNARIEKWSEMLETWSTFKKKNPNLLKSRVRKGIPDSLRGQVWQLLANTTELKVNHRPHLYFRLTNMIEDPPCMLTIEKDLDRTYPSHELFRSSLGQDSLRNILRSYAFYDPEIGYCQGMAYIVGIARMYMDEESAFWMLVSIMKFYDIRNMFMDGMVKVYECFYKANALLRIYEPAVWNKLMSIQFYPQIYSTQWFMTIYSNFPIENRLRIWDCFLMEGPKILFRVYVGIFRMNKAMFRDITFENTLKIIRKIEAECDCEELLKAAFSINLSRKKIKEIEREFYYSPNSELVSWK